MQANPDPSRLESEAAEAFYVAELAAFRAKRARLLVGSYSVGPDSYTSEFFPVLNRPPVEIEHQPAYPRFDEARSLHRLPNGDWLEIIGNGKAWTRHTYDLAYALDRARRQAIGGYALRADLVALICEIKAVGANRLGIYAMWQDVQADRPYSPAYSADGNLTAAEQQERWIECLTNDGLRLHPQHADLIRRAIELLREPDVLREYPAALNPELCQSIRQLEDKLARESAT